MEMPESKRSAAGDWISYREDIKVLDATIRDGGLMNDHKFDDAVVISAYKACVEAGIDYMEIGYKNSKKQFPKEEFGAWKHCDEDDMRRIVGDNDTDLKLSAMADAEKSDYKEDIIPSQESVLDMIRVATYIHQIPTALDMIKHAHDLGYETTVNLMAASVVPDSELEKGLELLAKSEVLAIYVVDSFGHLYSEQVQALMDRYLSICRPEGKQVGIHFHNNLQLGFANTIEGIIKGGTMIDSTMAGLGRGAGNCPTELLLSFLHNPKFSLRPVLDCVQNSIEPMRKMLMWGFDLPYMITGMLNQHPRDAMAFIAQKGNKDVLEFYDSLTQEV